MRRPNATLYEVRTELPTMSGEALPFRFVVGNFEKGESRYNLVSYFLQDTIIVDEPEFTMTAIRGARELKAAANLLKYEDYSSDQFGLDAAHVPVSTKLIRN